jgi:outer membrane protein assembly factor BamB
MNQRERNDAIFQAALTPVVSHQLTSGLADGIHDALVVTPQARPSSVGSLLGRGFPRLAGAAAAVLVILALLMLLSLMAALSRPKPGPLGVPMYRGGPARTGVMPGPGPAGDPTLLWQVSAKGPVAVMPAVVAGTVYVADDSGTVQALDEATGRLRWSRDLGGPVDGSPAVADGHLYVGTGAGQVVALDTATGVVAWRFTADGPVRASPAIVGEVLYVGSDDGNVYALDAATGSRRWARSLGAPVTRGVAVADGVVYAGATGGRFVAVDAVTGIVRWSKDDLGPGEVGTPMVADGFVFVAGGLLQVGPSDRITALDIRDGAERWHFATSDGQPLYNAAVADGAVYVSSNDGSVYRLDEQTGVVAPGWPFQARGGAGYVSGLVDGVLYVPSADQFLHAIDVVTGTERWKFKVKGAANVPAVVDGRIFVGTDLGKIVAIGGSQPAASVTP